MELNRALLKLVLGLAVLFIFAKSRHVIEASGSTPTVLITALYYDGYAANDYDEAVQLSNVISVPVDITAWRISSDGNAVTFSQVMLEPYQSIWCARRADAFARAFGFLPDYEYGGDSVAEVPDLHGDIPQFGNGGDECLLENATGEIVDAVVYEMREEGDSWQGAGVQPYSGFRQEGQIIYRRRDQTTGAVVDDTDTAADWAQHPADPIDGRKVLYPAWHLDEFFHTYRVTETARLRVLVAPDNLFDGIAQELTRATDNIKIEAYTFESAELCQIITEQLTAGVSVTMLLEGDPAVEGITDQELWILNEIAAAGGQIEFMYGDNAADIPPRYRYQHAKYIIVDDRVALIGSENLGYNAMPADDKADGATWGHRGLYLVTDAPGVVGHLRRIFILDRQYSDIVAWGTAPFTLTYPVTPTYSPEGWSYPLQFTAPLEITGTFAFEVVQSPENSLRDRDALLGLINRAEMGDVVYVEQMYEHRHWNQVAGYEDANGNPRLTAYINAARRGAQVRVLLDAYYDDANDDDSNFAACYYLNEVAQVEELDLACRRGNPTGLGIHNKMVLAHIAERGYVHVGSINGTENSNKCNREVALQVQADAAYDYLAAMFAYDWESSYFRVYLPVMCGG